MARPRLAERDSIRTERISLALSPVLYSGIKALADIQEVSVNDLLNTVVDNLVKKNREAISNFNTARRKAAESVDLTLDFGQPV